MSKHKKKRHKKRERLQCEVEILELQQRLHELKSQQQRTTVGFCQHLNRSEHENR